MLFFPEWFELMPCIWFFLPEFGEFIHHSNKHELACTQTPLKHASTPTNMSNPASASASPSSTDLILHPSPSFSRCQGPVLVCILDGWGESPYKDEYNAIYMAKTPTMDALRATAPRRWRLLKAHGTAVGLPSDADMGNSEVGHNALGAGQIVDQGAKCVDSALGKKTVWQGEGWQYVKPAAVSNTLHLIGLLSDGGVHSRYDQLMLLVQGAIDEGVTRIRFHCLSDGRDVQDYTAVVWLERLTRDLETLMTASKKMDLKIASGGGRMISTMDRYESDWKVVERGWDAAVLGEAPHKFVDYIQGVKQLQQAQGGTTLVSDQWIPPWVVVENEETNTPVGTIQDGDAVVAFNFRADRMIELSQAFEYGDDIFHGFPRRRRPSVSFAGMLEYDAELKLPKHYLVPPPLIDRASEQYLVATSSPWPTQIFACSESQKIGHVTFFWNGNRSGYLDPTKEKFVEIESDRGIPFDQAPAMKAREIAAAVVDAVASGKYDFIRCNFANGDMVGHTGNLKASIEACTVVDECVTKILEAVEGVGGRWLVTADHGNAEDMAKRDPKTGHPIFQSSSSSFNGNSGTVIPLTSHTLNPVPCAIGGRGLPDGVQFKQHGMEEAGLANVTATFLNLLGYEAPSFYEPSLIEVRGGDGV